MRTQAVPSGFLWNSCSQPAASWFLIWMPLALLTVDRFSDLGSAMSRLLAVLLVAGLLWARGLGPRGETADRTFVGAWAGAWAGALGALITTGAWQASLLGKAGLFATLFVGAGWLGWAYHERQELHRSVGRDVGSNDPASAAALSPPTLVSAWLAAALAFSLLALSGRTHWADAVVLFVSLVCFSAFQTGGLPTTRASRKAVES